MQLGGAQSWERERGEVGEEGEDGLAGVEVFALNSHMTVGNALSQPWDGNPTALS